MNKKIKLQIKTKKKTKKSFKVKYLTYINENYKQKLLKN